MKLTCDNVVATLVHCLFADHELVDGKPREDDSIIVKGIMAGFGLHKHRIEEKKADIKSMLEQLPEKFEDGCSFLELCMTREGHQWGEHKNMEELMVLGQAAGLVQLCMPREDWKYLPGGMPYYQFVPDGVRT